MVVSLRAALLLAQCCGLTWQTEPYRWVTGIAQVCRSDTSVRVQLLDKEADLSDGNKTECLVGRWHVGVPCGGVL